jgi:hypothetical protein
VSHDSHSPAPSRSEPRPVSYTRKLAGTAGSLAALQALPFAAQGAIVHGTAPVSLGLDAAPGSSVDWDADGNGGADFALFRIASQYDPTPSSPDFFNVDRVVLESYGRNGFALIAPANPASVEVQALQPGFRVGPTLSNYVWGAYSAYRSALVSGRHVSGSVSNPAFFGIGLEFDAHFAPGKGYFGFSFVDGVNLFDVYYGWALLDLDLVNRIVTIEEWAYNDRPHAFICVGETAGAGCGNPVPEPGTAALTLLGLGAGGLRAWRARRKARNECP